MEIQGQIQGAGARVARILLEGGPSTAANLADQLGLTAAAVRKTLEDLLALGFVEASERPAFGPDRRSRGRGRPARWYSLTASGRESFHSSYDDVAVGALRFMADAYGSEAVKDFARTRVVELERRYAATLDSEVPSGNAAEKAQVLADALNEDGYVATTVPVTGGIQICQHHCPVAHVAEEFPQFCEAETEAFGRMLGTHVLRLATIANGDGICTTHVPAVGIPPSDEKTGSRRTDS